MKRYTLAVAALLVLVPWHDAVRADVPLYTVQNLGTFMGETPTIAGVNSLGEVVGNIAGPNGSQAVRYRDGAWEALPGLETGFNVATGINRFGDVVGYASVGDTQRAFRYRDGFPLEYIEPLPGGMTTQGWAINDAGDIAGYSDAAGSSNKPFRASIGTLAVELPTLDGGFSLACGINASGQVAGISTTETGAMHGIRVDSGATTAVDVESFDGPAGMAVTCAIDADGRVGGQAVHGGLPHAFLFSGAGRVDLDPINSSESNVESIAGGLAVGWYRLADNSQRALGYRDEGGSFDLNTRIDAAGWVLERAKGVSANGIIVGEGTLDGAPAAFMLTVPPPPDTAAPVISSVSATPSSISPANGQMVGVSVTVAATDDSGQAPACTLTSITAPGASASDVSLTAPLAGMVAAVGGRTYTFHVSCADAANNTTAGSVDVTVPPDATAPVIASVSATPSPISPADGRTVSVAVAVSASDDSGDAPACSVTGVTGGAAGAASVTGPLSVSVKADGGANYTVNVRCSDAAGNSSNGAASVTVVAATTPPPTDTKPPVIRFLYAQRSETRLGGVPWENVRLFVYATDNVDHSPFCSIRSVTGGPAGSFSLTGRLSVRLREQRSAGDLNRTYVLHVACADDDGNQALATVSIDPNGRTTYSGDRRRWRW